MLEQLWCTFLLGELFLDGFFDVLHRTFIVGFLFISKAISNAIEPMSALDSCQRTFTRLVPGFELTSSSIPSNSSAALDSWFLAHVAQIPASPGSIWPLPRANLAFWWGVCHFPPDPPFTHVSQLFQISLFGGKVGVIGIAGRRNVTKSCSQNASEGAAALSGSRNTNWGVTIYSTSPHRDHQHKTPQYVDTRFERRMTKSDRVFQHTLLLLGPLWSLLFPLLSLRFFESVMSLDELEVYLVAILRNLAWVASKTRPGKESWRVWGLETWIWSTQDKADQSNHFGTIPLACDWAKESKFWEVLE